MSVFRLKGLKSFPSTGMTMRKSLCKDNSRGNEILCSIQRCHFNIPFMKVLLDDIIEKRLLLSKSFLIWHAWTMQFFRQRYSLGCLAWVGAHKWVHFAIALITYLMSNCRINFCFTLGCVHLKGQLGSRQGKWCWMLIVFFFGIYIFFFNNQRQ